ncbi:MAG TPA: hypothetical protein VGB37_13345 [Candidatus Lokiarchaeia archaeon]
MSIPVRCALIGRIFAIFIAVLPVPHPTSKYSLGNISLMADIFFATIESSPELKFNTENPIPGQRNRIIKTSPIKNNKNAIHP